jgi:YwqJ-like deaminase
MTPVPTLTERPPVRGSSSGRVRSGPTSGRKRRRARARAPRVPELGELLRSAQQSLDQDPLSPSASPPAFDFSRLRIHDDAEEGDQRRTEVLDPATLGIRMATDVLRSLRGDPEDKSRRVQLELARIDDPDLSTAVFAKLQVWLPSSEYSRVTNLVAEANASASPLPLQSSVYPAPVEEPDPLGDQVARDDAAVSDAANRAQLQAERLPWAAQTHAEKATAEAQKSASAADAEQQKKTAKQQAAESPASSQQRDALAAALRTGQTQAMAPQQGQQRVESQQGRAERDTATQPAAGPVAGPALPVAQTGGASTAPAITASDDTPPVALGQVDALAKAVDGLLGRPQARGTPGSTAERQPDEVSPAEEPIGADNTDLADIDVPEPELPALPPPRTAPSFPSPPLMATAATPPGREDPEEARLAAQAARAAATIEPAPGEAGPDTTEAEPDVMPEPAAPGPETDATAPGGPPPVASLEAIGRSLDGGAEPSADAGSAGGGAAGGGPVGGGGSAAPPPQPEIPDVSQQRPQTALAVVGALPAVQLARGLSGVNSSVGHSVSQQRAALAKSPPELHRPSGAPHTLHGIPPVAPPANYGTDKVQKATAKEPGQQAKPQGKQVAGGPNPAGQVPAPKVTGNAKGDVTATDVQNVQQAVNNVPTTDPALDHASVGVAPKVQLTGQADPVLTDTQLTNMRDRAARILTTGRDDATRPLGEDEIYPDVPPNEVLKASVSKGGAATPAAGTAVESGPAGDQAVSAIAKQERGPQIRAAVSQGESQMTAGEQAKQRQEARDRQQHHAKIAAAIKKSTDDETKERDKVAVQARQQRKDWQDQEDKLTSGADTEAGRKHDKARGDIEKKKSDTDTEIGKRQQAGNAKIIAKRKEAEAKARAEQAKKQNQSGGWFGWVCSAVSDAFHALVSAVTGIFDAARKFVQGVINTFKKLATGLINAARKWIIAQISVFASVLLAIGNVLLAAFPALRDKFRKLIIGMRNAAIALVNKVANFLERAITALLNLLGKALSALLDLLQKQLLAAIKSVEAKIQGVINFVKNAIALLGQFAVIVRDVAANPGLWIRKLGSAIVDGIHYYLWDAIKTAVKAWFIGQIQQILGLGQMLQGGMRLIDALRRGAITIGKIVQMAWQAMISALPSMLIQLVIQKLVAFLVPALGGIIQIVQGVIAAYKTISSIITAISKFVAFLKAVISGTAARMFATAVAAGAVALIAFISNWLLSKLKGAAEGLGSKLKGMAEKILAFLKRGATDVRKGIGTAVNLVKRGAKAAAGLIKRGLRAVMKGVRALGRRLAKTRFGKFLKDTYDKLKTKYQAFKSKLAEWRNNFKTWREKRQRIKATERASPEHVQKLVNGVQARARFVAETESNKVRGPVLSGALDTKTGQIFYGQNEADVPGNLHPEIQAALADFKGPGAPLKGQPGSHSEVYAVNEGLHARQGAKISDFLLFSVRLQRKRLGEQILKCPNCAQILKGASDLWYQ